MRALAAIERFISLTVVRGRAWKAGVSASSARSSGSNSCWYWFWAGLVLINGGARKQKSTHKPYNQAAAVAGFDAYSLWGIQPSLKYTYTTLVYLLYLVFWLVYCNINRNCSFGRWSAVFFFCSCNECDAIRWSWKFVWNCQKKAFGKCQNKLSRSRSQSQSGNSLAPTLSLSLLKLTGTLKSRRDRVVLESKNSLYHIRFATRIAR